jgi:ABC-2 type transport system permease protein
MSITINKQTLRGVMVTTEKNIRIYYTKPPVIIFGLLFPLFMFLAFYLGRDIDFSLFFPGLLAMFLFFIASSVGPLITPWEKQARTYERLLAFPVTINTIIIGDTLAGMIFGIMINLVVLAGGLIFLTYHVNILPLTIGILLGAFCFSSIGVFLASPSVPNPSHIMMLSSLVRFPLIFISGIFIPLSQLKGIGKALAYFSPLTYLVDIFQFSFKGTPSIPIIIDFLMLLFFSIVFVFLSNRIHKRNLMKGL